MRASSILGLAVLSVCTLGCAQRPDVVLIHNESSEAAKHVVELEFTTTLTMPDNFVLRPDEFGGAAVDHARKLVDVGSRDGHLLALDSASGQVAWDVSLTDSVSSVPVITSVPSDDGDSADSVILVGTDNGVLHAIDAQTQESRWEYETPGRLRNEPVIADGTVFFANSRDQIYALDIRTGEWRWQYEQEFSHDFTVYGRAGLTFVPARADAAAGEIGTLYTGFDNGRVVALAANSGQVLWLANVAPPQGGDFVDCDSTPWVDVDAGMVVVTGQSTGVHALSLEDGSLLWNYPVQGAGSVVAAEDGSLVAASSLQGVFALDTQGHLRWRTEINPGVLRGPVIVDNTAFVTHADLGLLALDAVNGDVLAQLPTGSGASSPPVYDAVGHRLYVTSNRGTFMSLRVGDGLLTSSVR